uniref:Fad NAD binding oxidoreductases n=1 Tax=Solanum tuberosum TaxID=4113 RepID=M1DFW8_SOLTU
MGGSPVSDYWEFIANDAQTLHMIGCIVLFDNKTEEPAKKAEQLREFLFHVNMVVQMTGGKPYTRELFEEVKKMKLHNDSLESEAESKIRELKDSLEKVQRETEELTVKHHSYICYKCQRHVSSHEDTISTKFQSKKGKAFLFAHVRNVVVGTNEEKHLTTSLHTIDDIYRVDCNEVLDWKYEQAVEPSQKYKEGKFVLELCKIVKDNR